MNEANGHAALANSDGKCNLIDFSLDRGFLFKRMICLIETLKVGWMGKPISFRPETPNQRVCENL